MTEAQLIAEGVAHDAYMNYHRARLQLGGGLHTVDQLRKYTVSDRGDHYAIIYRNGINAGLPSVYATVNKTTLNVCLN